MKQKNGYPNGEEKQAKLLVEDSNVMQLLVGDSDSNLKTVSRILDIQISRNGNSISISGQDSDVDLAEDTLSQIKDLLSKGEKIWPGDIERAIKMLSSNRKLKLEELFREQVKVAGKRNTIIPKTFQQKNYMEAVYENDIVFGVGPAGTGKTYLAMAVAVSALLKKQVKRVVLCRPAVEAGEKLGFLPGDLAEKVNPYLRPLYDALYDMIEPERAQEMIEKGMIEVAPLAFMRGRTLSNAFVILDEAQNTTPSQMKMFITRLGFGSKCFITGDITQIDLPRGTQSGLIDAIGTLDHIPGLAFVHFSEEDVIRHPLVAKIIIAYNRKEASERRQ